MKNLTLLHYNLLGISSLYFVIQTLGYDSFILMTMMIFNAVMIVKRGILTHLYYRYSYCDFIKNRMIQLVVIMPLFLNSVYQWILGNYASLFSLFLLLSVLMLSFIYQLNRAELVINAGILWFMIGVYSGYNSDYSVILTPTKSNMLFIGALVIFILLVVYMSIRNYKMRKNYEKV